MLIARGYRVSFELDDGRVIRAPRGAEILQDEGGVDWPASSALVMLYGHTGKPLTGRLPGYVRKHFGEDYQPLRGKVTLPPKRLSSWTEVGAVKVVKYHRRGGEGMASPPEGDEHVFGEREWIFRRKLPVLYKRGEVLLRLEGVTWDHGGARG